MFVLKSVRLKQTDFSRAAFYSSFILRIRSFGTLWRMPLMWVFLSKFYFTTHISWRYMNCLKQSIWILCAECKWNYVAEWNCVLKMVTYLYYEYVNSYSIRYCSIIVGKLQNPENSLILHLNTTKRTKTWSDENLL